MAAKRVKVGARPAAAEQGPGEHARVALAERDPRAVDAVVDGARQFTRHLAFPEARVPAASPSLHESRGGDEGSGGVEALHYGKVLGELEGCAAHGAPDVERQARGLRPARLNTLRVLGAQVRAPLREPERVVGAVPVRQHVVWIAKVKLQVLVHRALRLVHGRSTARARARAGGARFPGIHAVEVPGAPAFFFFLPFLPPFPAAGVDGADDIP